MFNHDVFYDVTCPECGTYISAPGPKVKSGQEDLEEQPVALKCLNCGLVSKAKKRYRMSVHRY